MTAHPEDKNLASILNDFRRRLFELERRTLRLPDSAGPLETFDNGTPIGETRFLDFGVGLTATRIGDDFVQVNGADAETEFDAIVDPSLAQDDPSARLFTTPGRAGDYLRNTVGLTERANIFVRRRSPSAASPSAMVETASYTFPDHVFIYCPGTGGVGLMTGQVAGQREDVTWDHASFAMTAQTWEVHGLHIETGSAKSTMFNGRVRLVDCQLDVGALVVAERGKNVTVGSSGHTTLIRCYSVGEAWFHFSIAVECVFRIYKGGTYDPSDNSGYFQMLDCKLDAATVFSDAVTWTLGQTFTTMRLADFGGGGLVTCNLSNTNGMYDIQSQCNATAIAITNSVNSRRVVLNGQFNSVQVAAPSSSNSHSLDIRCSSLNLGGPAVIDINVTGGEVTLGGDRVTGHVTGARGSSSGAWLNFVAATRCRIDASCNPSGGSGTFKAYTFDASSSNNLLAMHRTAEFPAAGTDSGTNNVILPEQVLLTSGTPGGELGGTWASPTVDPTHSGSAHGVAVEDEGSAQGQALTLDFAGAGVTATVTGSEATITIPGGGSGVDVEEEGVAEGTASVLDFTGSGVDVSFAGGTATIDIPGGGTGVDIEDEGAAEGTADTIDFTGAGVSVTFAAGTATVDIPGYLVTHARNNRTSGNLTLNSTTWTDLDTGLDITLAAADGDWVEVGVSGLTDNQGVFAYLDVVSVVSGSPVNSWADEAAPDNSHNGVVGWEMIASTYSQISGSIIKQLVAGDISGGNVTLRLRYRTSAASPKTVFATASNPLTFWARVVS